MTSTHTVADRFFWTFTQAETCQIAPDDDSKTFLSTDPEFKTSQVSLRLTFHWPAFIQSPKVTGVSQRASPRPLFCGPQASADSQRIFFSPWTHRAVRVPNWTDSQPKRCSLTKNPESRVRDRREAASRYLPVPSQTLSLFQAKSIGCSSTHTQTTHCFLIFFGGGVSAADTVDHTERGSARVCAVATKRGPEMMELFLVHHTEEWKPRAGGSLFGKIKAD